MAHVSQSISTSFLLFIWSLYLTRPRLAMVCDQKNPTDEKSHQIEQMFENLQKLHPKAEGAYKREWTSMFGYARYDLDTPPFSSFSSRIHLHLSSILPSRLGFFG